MHGSDIGCQQDGYRGSAHFDPGSLHALQSPRQVPRPHPEAEAPGDELVGTAWRLGVSYHPVLIVTLLGVLKGLNV